MSLSRRPSYAKELIATAQHAVDESRAQTERAERVLEASRALRGRAQESLASARSRIDQERVDRH
jgi:hypothetical protein